MNRMRRRYPDGIPPGWLDARRVIGRTLVSREERAAVERPRDIRCESTEGLAADVRQVSVPSGILDGHVPWPITGSHTQPGELGENAVSHERTHTNRTVVCAGHRV